MYSVLRYFFWLKPLRGKIFFILPWNQPRILVAKVKMQYPQLNVRKGKAEKCYCWAQPPVLVSPDGSPRWFWSGFDPSSVLSCQDKDNVQNWGCSNDPVTCTCRGTWAFWALCCPHALKSVSQRYRSSQTTHCLTAQAWFGEKINPQSKQIG